MSDQPKQQPSLRYHFVDEAGDPVLFNRDKQTVVGTAGCSTYFILGLLDLADPLRLDTEMAELRNRMLADPYFKDVPSMRPERQKTAIAFHAKTEGCPGKRPQQLPTHLGHRGKRPDRRLSDGCPAVGGATGRGLFSLGFAAAL
jgi:hypothetical protein